MSVLIFFGMAFFVIALGIGVVVSTLLHWKREGVPESARQKWKRMEKNNGVVERD